MLLPPHKLPQVDYYSVKMHKSRFEKSIFEKHTTSITIHWKQWWKFSTAFKFKTMVEITHEDDISTKYNIAYHSEHVQLQQQLDNYFHNQVDNALII